MKLEKLKAFVVVADELNFRKSAEILGMAQPPLTRLIASLEKDLSTKLFERTTRQVQLTSAGIYLLKSGKEIIAQAEKAEREVRAIGKMRSGKLSVSFSRACFMASLPVIIREFQNRFPKIKLELQEERSDKILKGLKSGRYDVGFLDGTIADSELKNRAIRDEALGVLLPDHHPLAKRKFIEIKDLKNDTIILHSKKEAGGFYNAILRLFELSGIRPNIYVKKEKEICPELVASGKGLSLRISGSHPSHFPGTELVPIRNSFLPVSVFWLEENERQEFKSFLSFVTEKDILRSKESECLMEILPGLS
ncbi:LysR family transcriptional regulator [Leptospira wolffii]|uniref:LysR family transcriptional regulator n=1 Tax=Leptospira wolffii TaxID=409998 RepID=A0A2M9Z7V6_9LEPT|nr:LysR family transcriptional regulator [Leptospira wolffii]PJZ64412.1 LysR family transcriptional regulator [Leptospira wolffii]